MPTATASAHRAGGAIDRRREGRAGACGMEKISTGRGLMDAGEAENRGESPPHGAWGYPERMHAEGARGYTRKIAPSFLPIRALAPTSVRVSRAIPHTPMALATYGPSPSRMVNARMALVMG